MILLTLALMFGRLSLLAVGGVNSTLPQIAHEVVDQRHWVTAQQFSQLFAIAQAAPGPNLLIVGLIGAREAGAPGLIIAALAMILPAGTLVILAASLWQRYQTARWRRIIQAAILPITAGLVLAAAFVLCQAADTTIPLAALTTLATWATLRTRLHPILLLAAGTAAGLVMGGT